MNKKEEWEELGEYSWCMQEKEGVCKRKKVYARERRCMQEKEGVCKRKKVKWMCVCAEGRRQKAEEAYKFDVTIGREQEVLWFEIPVDDATAVQVMERLHHTGRVEPSGRVVEWAPADTDTHTSLLAHITCTYSGAYAHMLNIVQKNTKSRHLKSLFSSILSCIYAGLQSLLTMKILFPISLKYSIIKNTMSKITDGSSFADSIIYLFFQIT